jgi:hypothetical protein
VKEIEVADRRGERGRAWSQIIRQKKAWSFINYSILSVAE